MMYDDYIIQAVSHVLAWTNADINIKNLEGKTA
jgi:hypothetical protein